MSEPRVTCCGKEVLLDGRHIADASSNLAAQALATALQYAGPGIPDELNQPLMEFLG